MMEELKDELEAVTDLVPDSSLADIRDMFESLESQLHIVQHEILLKSDLAPMTSKVLDFKLAKHLDLGSDLPIHERKLLLYTYESSNGFDKFYNSIRRKDQAKIRKRFMMIQENQNFGMHKSLKGRPGVFELKFDSSLRVYYTLHDGGVIILNGGLKDLQTQDCVQSEKFLANFLRENP